MKGGMGRTRNGMNEKRNRMNAQTKWDVGMEQTRNGIKTNVGMGKTEERDEWIEEWFARTFDGRKLYLLSIHLQVDLLVQVLEYNFHFR